MAPMGRKGWLPRGAALVAALALGGFLALAGSGAPGTLPTLYVNYSENCTFTLTDDAGNAVGAIAPGTYQVEVQTPGDFGAVDLNGITDMTACRGFVQFQLTGPGVSIQTTLDDGDSDFALATGVFRPNATYTAVDENQPSVARDVFTTNGSTAGPPPVTTAPTQTTTGSAKASTVFRGTLLATVNAGGTLTLTTAAGKPVVSLRSGRYIFAVTDRSKTRGFALSELGKAVTPLTASGFVGTRRVTVELPPGQWSFYPGVFHQRSYFSVVG
jgi:hypothetical protein